MPALVEITLFGWDAWADDGWNIWQNDGWNTFVDTKKSIHVSHGGYAGEKFWEPKILSFTSPQFRLDHASGGYCKLGFGDLTLAPDTFDLIDTWPPPENCEVKIYFAVEDSAINYLTDQDGNLITDENGNPIEVSYESGLYNGYEYLTDQNGEILTDDTGDPILIATTSLYGGDVHELFDGTLHRTGLSRDGITYQLYERSFDAVLLDSATDFDGNIVPLPIAFGVVVNQQPVRLPDAIDGHRRYSAGSLTGTKHTNWHVYDDGVDVCSQATEISNNVFEYTVQPAGELTISGTGSAATIVDVFTWACGVSRLNLIVNSLLSGAYVPSFWASSQEPLMSFLDRLASVACHLFYISNDKLYLVDMSADNGAPIVMTENDFYPAAIKYAAPVSLIKTSWTDRVAVEETIGKYIKEIPREVSVVGAHPYGTEESVDCFQSTIPSVTASLTEILSFMTAPRWETSIPMVNIFPNPGCKIIAYDESMGHGLNIEIRARDIEYDFENKEIRIAGEGTVT
jgi:hypothetical protein